MLSLREERTEGAVSLKAFYLRRSFRILPMYYLALFLMTFLTFGLGWGKGESENFKAAIPSTYLVPEIPCIPG